MSHFKTLVNEYVRDGDTWIMEILTDKIDRFVDKVMETNKDLAEHFLTKVDLILNPHFTKHTAEMVVDKFDNRDGSTGPHWSYEQTSKVLDAKRLDYNEADWYVCLNMMWSDYYKNGRPDDLYIDLACDFLDDPDGPEGKMKKYWLGMNY